jgi:hypothetical protein
VSGVLVSGLAAEAGCRLPLWSVLAGGVALGVALGVGARSWRTAAGPTDPATTLSDAETALLADMDDALRPFAAQRFPYPPTMVDFVEPAWKEAFWVFVETGALSDSFKTHAQGCRGCQQALTMAYDVQTKAMGALATAIQTEQRRFEAGQHRAAATGRSTPSW